MLDTFKYKTITIYSNISRNDSFSIDTIIFINWFFNNCSYFGLSVTILMFTAVEKLRKDLIYHRTSTFSLNLFKLCFCNSIKSKTPYGRSQGFFSLCILQDYISRYENSPGIFIYVIKVTLIKKKFYRNCILIIIF